MLITPTFTPIVLITPPPSVVEAVSKPQAENKSGADDTQHNGQEHGAFKNKSTHSLSDEERAEARQLAQRDREVRAHEAAHKGAAGRYARGGAEFEYERGPDGRQYAVGGEVSIDTSRPSDPQAALQKAMIIRRAALAPAQPSAQDRSVAAEAAQMAQQAKTELLEERSEASTGGDEKSENNALSTSLGRAYDSASEPLDPSINITV